VGNQPRLLLRLQQRRYGKSSALSDVAVRGMNPRYKRMTKRKKQEPAFMALSYHSERGWAGRSFFRLGLPLHHHNRGLSRPWLRGHLCPCSAVSLQSYLSPLSVCGQGYGIGIGIGIRGRFGYRAGLKVHKSHNAARCRLHYTHKSSGEELTWDVSDEDPV
jgi:hypothetical protein